MSMSEIVTAVSSYSLFNEAAIFKVANQKLVVLALPVPILDKEAKQLAQI